MRKVSLNSHQIFVLQNSFNRKPVFLDLNLPPYCRGERVFEVLGVADALNWKTFSLLGHSMGGAVATLGIQCPEVETITLFVQNKFSCDFRILSEIVPD